MLKIAHTKVRDLPLAIALAFSLAFVGHSAIAQSDVVRFGQVLPLSGPLANVGKEIQAATQAAVDAHNSTQKLRIEILVEDDANNPERSAAAVQKIADKSTALLSCFGTVGCLAQMRASQTLNLPLIGPIAGAAELRAPSATHVFPVRASASEELARLIQFSQTMNLVQWVVLVQNDGFGQAYFSVLKTLLEGSGIQLSAVSTLNPQQPDYAASVLELNKPQSKALVLLANPTHSIGLLKAWREKSQLPFVMNLSGQANGLFAKGLLGYSGAAAFVVTTPSPWGKKYAIQKNYQAAMKAAGITNLSYLSFEAYINATVAIDAVTRARGRSGPAFRSALQNSVVDLGALSWRFDTPSKARLTDMAVLRPDGSYMQ